MIDTQQKRMSAAGAGRPWKRGVFPVATPTEAWRLNVGMAYAGNALSPAIGAPVNMLMNQRGYLQAKIHGFRSIILALMGF